MTKYLPLEGSLEAHVDKVGKELNPREYHLDGHLHSSFRRRLGLHLDAKYQNLTYSQFIDAVNLLKNESITKYVIEKIQTTGRDDRSLNYNRIIKDQIDRLYFNNIAES